MTENILDHPLFSASLTGTTVVEASAGTGKTWTITGLYLRLFVEQELDPNTILVVTFTNAATAELKERIRSRLQALRSALEGTTEGDPLIRAIIDRAPDRARLKRRAALAVESFDEAAIHTIHGFCQRLLGDHAFEAAMPFAAEIAPDEAVVNEIARDFWRVETHDIDAVWARYMVDLALDPDALVRTGRPLLHRRDITRVFVAPEAVEGATAAFAATYSAMRALWQSDRATLNALLSSPALNRKRYQPTSVAAWFEALDSFFADDYPGVTVPKCMDRFTVAKLAESTKIERQSKAKQAAPAHAFFALAEQLLAQSGLAKSALESKWIDLVQRFVAHARTQIEQRKLELGQLSYDDLLLRVQRALEADRQGTLRRSIGSRYRAALIDEFQDTDDVQYAILGRLFAAAERTLYLVGDPKQAIYGFRGADVFAYLRARGQTSKQLKLQVNRRSSADLLDAINTLFGSVASPFASTEIAFSPAQPDPTRTEGLELRRPSAPLRLWYVPGAFNKREVENKGSLRARVALATAGDVAALLEDGRAGRATLVADGVRRPIHGADIAVLVRRHADARRMREALAARGIAAVTLGQESVFDSPEASELAQVLAAVAQPNDEQLLRGALATTLFGHTLGEIAGLTERVASWEAQLDRFRHLNEILRSGGVARLMRELIEAHDVCARLQGYLDGERRLTNFQHLAELLHQVASERGFDPAGIARYLARMVGRGAGQDEAEQIRLESDEQLVRVITIHVAKGLEFPIVYCPFLWDANTAVARSKPPVLFHQPGADHALAVDLGSDRLALHRGIAATEDFAEQLRLAYVALTRAKHRCTIVWGAAKEGAASALAWLLHGPRSHVDDVGVARAAMQDRLTKLSAEALLAEVSAFAARSGGSIEVVPLPPVDVNELASDVRLLRLGQAMNFSGVVPGPRRVASFSSLHAGVELDEPDRDGFASSFTVGDEEGARASDPILEFPRGAKTGSCLHAVFERVMREPSSLSALTNQTVEIWAREALEAHGMAPRLAPIVRGMVTETLNAPLDSDRGLTLASIAARARLPEVEFHYPVRARDWIALAGALARHRAERGLPDSTSPLLSTARPARFVKGFIDLVFESAGRYFVADYKSNWLGPALEHYAEASLVTAIAAEHYDLQYLLYTLAVDRWLARRIRGYAYARHFGGVYYLFTRGMRVAGPAQCGVYFARPSITTINQLRAIAVHPNQVSA